MSLAAPAARTVLVLGRAVGEDAIGFAERAARLGSELVLLSLGYPPTGEQQALVQGALAIIAETHSSLDAVLVPDVEELPRFLVHDDRVAVFAGGLERRTIERVLRRGSGQASPTGGASSSASGSGSSSRATSAS